jgi:hypothetical protein
MDARAERPAEPARPTGAARLTQAWRALPSDQRLASVAAVGLFVSMLLPWYEKSFAPRGAKSFVHDNLNAFQKFSFVEGAVLLVSAGVLVLLLARAERRAFHLPGGDGTVLMAAGAWAALLIVYRFFDKPGVDSRGDGAATIGLQWGIFVAFAAAGVLAYAGSRVRAAHRPEPEPSPRRRAAPAPHPPESYPGADPGPDPPTIRLPRSDDETKVMHKAADDDTTTLPRSDDVTERVSPPAVVRDVEPPTEESPDDGRLF